MATTSIPWQRASLNTLLATTGDSLKAAQSSLSTPLGVPAGMLLSEAVLEVKATVQQASNGELQLDLIGSSHLAGPINPSAVSTLRMSFTAAALEAGTGSKAATSGPTKTPDRVRAEFLERPDIAVVASIVGALFVEPRFLPDSKQWLVTATDAAGRTVRSQLISDLPTRS